MKTNIFKIFCLLSFSFMQHSFAQWTTPTVDAINDGVGNYPNNYTSGATNWALTWNNTDLFVCLNNANQTEAVSIYLDVDPIVPVNGGANGNGTLVGLNYDGFTTRPNLPFRADVCIYIHNGSREILRRDGANGWTSLGAGVDGICGGGTNDATGNVNGQFATNDNGNGNSGDDRREFRISWSRLQGVINGGIRPNAFNWMGYISRNNEMYAQVPSENYGGTNVIGNSNGIIRYFTVSNTTNGSSTNPFGQNSFTQPITASNAAFGAISAFDFTMNSSGQTITRTAGGGQSWNITGNLVIAAGTLSSGTSTTAISTNNLDIRGGTFTLSGSAGGDLNVSGNFIKTSGTFNCNGRQVNFNGSTAQTYSSNATQTINYLLISNTGGTVTANSSITVPNNLTINAGANCRLNMGNNTLNLTSSVGNIINGNLRIGGTGGTITGTSAANTTFGAGSYYEHNYSTVDGSIPMATWNSSSTCLIMGYTTGTQPTSGLNQNFGNFVWNCPSQTTSPMLDGELTTVNGNLEILALNGNEIGITTNVFCTLTIGGDLTIADGIFALATGGASCNLIINGNLNLNSASSFLLLTDIASTGGNGIINITGNLNHNDGTIDLATSDFDGLITVGGDYTQSASAVLSVFSLSLSTGSYVEFNGPGVQNVTLNGTITSNVNFRVNGGGINLTGILSLNDNANGGSWGASLRMSQGSITGSGTVFYDQTGGYSTLIYDASTAAQTTNNIEFPAINGPMNLIIDNTFATNTVTLHASRTIGGTITLNQGILVLNGNNLSVVEPPVGGNANSYVKTNGAGFLQIALMGGGFSFNFPVGNSSYNPITIANSGTTDSYSVRVTDGTPPSPNDPTKVINRSWIVSEGTIGGSNINLIANWNSPSEEAINFNSGVTRRFGMWNGASWSQNGASVGGSNPYYFSTLSSFASVGTFALGKDDAFISSATTYTWNGSTNGTWSTATNWTPNGIPGASDNVVFNVVGTNPTNFNSTQTVNDLTLNGTGSLNLGASGNITIAGNFTYVNTASANFDCASTLNVNSAASQTIPAFNYGNLNINGGPRVLSNAATINICGNYTPTSGVTTTTGSTVNFNGTVAQNILTTSATFNNLIISNTAANVTSSVAVTITNNLTINAGANCRFDIGTNTLTLTGSTANIINGTLRAGGTSGSIVGMTALNTTFSATGTYEHNYTTIAGTIPTATWNAASNCNVIGYTTNVGATGGLSQNFGNFTWNCPLQTGALNLLGGFNGAIIAGNLNVIATNSGSLRLTGSASFTLTINGNLNVSGGTFAFTNALTPNAPNITINIGGVFNITGGVTNFQTPPPASTGGIPTFTVATSSFNMSAGSLVIYNASAGLGSTATINISGNFTQSGGTVNNCSIGAANGTITTWNILGNFNQTAGTYTGASLGINPEIYLNVNGSFSQSLGATLNAGAAIPKFQIEFKGTINQNVSVSGSTLNNIWWRLNNAAGITLATNININSLGKFIRTNGAIAGIGAIVYAGGSQLRYNGTTNITSTDKEWPSAMTSVSVEIDNVAGVNMHASRTAVGPGGEVRLTNGCLYLGNNDLLIDYVGSGNYSITSPSSTNMFVTNGTGQFMLSTYVRSGSPVGSDNYAFQIGENTGSAEYTPVHIKFFKNTVSRIIGLRVVDAISPNINTPIAATDYLSRYWIVTENTAGGLYRDSITVFYAPSDVNGTEANLKFSTFSAGNWTEHGTTVTAGTKLEGFQPSTAAFTQTYLPLNGLEITGRRAPNTITWVGTTSNDWNTGSNWSSGTVPTSTQNVIIGVSSPNPCNINSASYTVNDLTLNGTGVLNLAAGTSLSINGNFTYVNTATANFNCSSTLNIASTSSQNIPALNYGNLNLTGGPRVFANTGTIAICGNYTPSAGITTTTGSTINFNGTTAQSILSNAATFNNLTISNTASTVTSGVNVTLSGTGTINSNAIFDQSAAIFTINATTTTNVSGTFRNSGGTIVNSGTLNFLATGVYHHARNGGSIVNATTWNAGSLCNITGVIGTMPSGLNQTFSDFTYNCAGQTASISFSFTSLFSCRDFTFVNSNGFNTSMISGTSATMTINRNMLVQGGVLRGTAGAGVATINITGNFTISGGTFEVSAGSGGATVNHTGNFTQSAGTITRTTGTATWNFRKIGAPLAYAIQNISQSGGTISGTLTFNAGVAGPTYSQPTLLTNFAIGAGGTFAVTSGSGIDFSTFVLSGNIFTLSNGGLAISANTAGFVTAPTLSGSVQTTTRTFNAACNFAFTGTALQSTGSAMPATATYVYIANVNNVNLSSSLTLNDAGFGAGVIFVAGHLQLGVNNLTLTGTAPAITSASATQHIKTNGTGRLRRVVAATPVVFPIGNVAYNPITLTNSGTSDTYGVRVIDAVVSPAPYDASKLINRYWEVNESIAGGSNIISNAQYNSGEPNANFAAGVQLKMGLHNGTNWSESNASSSGGGPFVVTNSTSFLPSVATYTLGVGKDDGFIPPFFTYTWNGSISNDWGTAANWTPSGIPAAIDNIIIPTSGSYTNELVITGSRNITDFAVNGNGKYTMSAGTSLTVTGNYSYSSSVSSTFDCSSTLTISSSVSQTIPAANYGNLDLTGGNRVLANSGIIGICGTFTRGAGAYTLTGSTVDYNGTGVQTLSIGQYNNLSISNARGSANLISPAGTISVGGVFDVSTLSAYTPVVNASSIFDFTSASAQTIPAFYYGQLNNSGNGNRTWANSGIIDIAQGFNPTTATNTITGSTIRYSNTSATTWSLSSFTTNVANRLYHNLEFVGGASTIWQEATAYNFGITGNLTLSGLGRLNAHANAGTITWTVDGNLIINGGGNLTISNSGGTATFNVIGNSNVSAGSITIVSSTVGALTQTFTTSDLTLSGTGSINMDAVNNTTVASVTVNGNLSITSTTANCVNFGSGTSNTNNVINLKGNLNKSGVGNIGLTGSYAASAGFIFNGVGIQTYSHLGAAMTGGIITIATGSTVQLLTNLVTANSAQTNPLTIAGTLDCSTFTVSNGNAANTFSLTGTGNLIINNSGGVSSTIIGFANANTTWSNGATFTFNGNTQNTGMNGYAAITVANNYNVTWLGTTSLTIDKTLSITTFNFTNAGLILLGTFDLTITSAGSIVGAGYSSTKMFVTNSSGQLRKSFTSPSSVAFTWPIGDNTAGDDYSPVTINITSGGSGTVGFRVIDAVHPNNAPTLNFLSRYWSASTTFAVAHSWNGTFSYTGADINGIETNMKLNIWDPIALGWTEYSSSSAGANVLNVSSGPAAGSLSSTDITGRTDIPVYYQSVAAGAWSSASNWEVADNIGFVGAIPAVVAPNNVNSGGIWIRSGSPITIGSNITADQITVDAGAILTIGVGGDFTLANGVGTDLTIDGDFNVNNTCTTNPGSSVALNGTWTTTVGSGVLTTIGSLVVSSTGVYTNNVNGGSIPTGTWNAGSKLNIQGVTNSGLTGGLGQLFWDVEWNCSSQTNAINLSTTPFVTIANDFIVTNTNGFDLRLFSGSTGGTTNINGDLIINGGNLALSGGGASTSSTVDVNIGGNVILNGGTLSTAGLSNIAAQTCNFNITGNMNLNGGNLNIYTGAFTITANHTINLIGNLAITSGTISRTGVLTSIFRFNKSSGVQTYNSTAPGTSISSSPILWEVGNGTTSPTLQLNSDFIEHAASIMNVQNLATLDVGNLIVAGTTAGVNGSFNLNSGATLITANTAGIVAALAATSGSIQTGSAKTFHTNANYTYNAAVNQVTGTGLPTPHTGVLRIDNSGGAVTLTNVPSTGSTLILANGIFQIGIGQTYNIANGGTITGIAGDFAVGSIGGTINFIGAGTFTGNTNPYNVYINGSVNFGNTTTIQNSGTMRINAGGAAISNAPAYATGSVLEYNTGGIYHRGIEWSTTSGKGFPYHVTVINSTLNPAGPGAINASMPFNLAGDLSINSSGAIMMNHSGNNMLVPLIINGNLNLIGNLSASGAAGGDIALKGNWDNNGAAINNFTPNNRAVTLNGTSIQNIGGTNTTVNPFGILVINNAAGVVLTSTNVEINDQLSFILGNLTIGNTNIKLNGLNTPLTGASSTKFIITNGTGALSRNFDNSATLFPIGPNASTFSPVTLQQTGIVDDISVRVNTAPAFSFAVNDNNQMVNLEWIFNEAAIGGNNLVSNFQWPVTSEAAGFIRANGVYQGDYSGASWQARPSTTSGGNPYLSSSSINYNGSLSNRPFVLGNIFGIIGCVATASAGNWNNAATWVGGVIPPVSSSVCLGHAVLITGSNTNALSSLTLNPGASLDIDPTRSLIFNSSATLNNNTGASTAITGLGSIIFNGDATLSGANPITLNNIELNGNTTISTPLTVNGDLYLNSGSTISATPTYSSSSRLIYNLGGNYNVNLEWTGNSNSAGFGIPNNVNIRNNTTLNMPSSDRGIEGSMSIEVGTLEMGTADLYINGDWTRHNTNGFFNPNNRSVIFNRSGTQNISITGGGTEIFDYLVLDKPSGSLVLNSTDITNVTINGNSGNTLQFLDNGSLDINGNQLNFTNAGGSILVSGGTRNIISTFINGQVNIQASTSVNSTLGGSLIFDSNVKVSLSSSFNFGNSISTIQGVLEIAPGGLVNTNPANYDVNSTLRYFTGSAIGRGLEWSATTGPGYPYHVNIDQNITATTLDLSNGGSALRQIAGNLNINNGGNLTMNAMTHPLVVKGDVNIGGLSSGSLTLSTAVNGDIQIGGNLTRNAGGIFNQNSREITMNGNSLQTISNNIPNFDFLNIDNNGNSVQINTNTSIGSRLKLSNGTFDLNGFTATMANGSQIRRSAATALMSAAPTINGGNQIDMRYDATMTSDVEFIQDLNKIRDLEINAGVLTINENKTINRDLILSGGDLNLSTFIFTDRGNAIAPAFAGNITLSGGGIRSIIGLPGSIFDITGLGGNSPLMYTKTINSIGGTTLNFDSNVLLRIGDGAVDFGLGNPTTVNGVLQVMQAGSVGPLLNSCIYGTNSILRFANAVDYQVNITDKTWATGAINSGNAGIPWHVDVLNTNTDLTIQDTRSLRGNLTINDGTFTLAPSFTGSFNLGGNWTRTGANSAFTHNNKKVTFNNQLVGDQMITINTGVTSETYYDLDINPTSGNIILNGHVNAINSIVFVNGKIDLNGNEFTLGTNGVNGTLSGASATSYFISGNTASKFIRFTTSASTNYNFPVGDNSNYTPMSVQLYASPMAANSLVSVNVIPNAHPNLGSSTNYLSRYWQVEPSNFPTPQTGYGVTYQWAASDEGTAPIPANLKPYKHNTQGWIAANGSGAVFEMGSGTVNPGTRTITWDGLYSFSDFTGNGNGSPLPITLLSFDVQPILENVAITWSTASETNNDFFTIERSQDGTTFNELTKVNGAGNSNTILNYKVTDFEPYEGLSYYRLKQTDFDGKVVYSEIKTVQFTKPIEGQNWTVFPNPSNINGVNLLIGKTVNASVSVSLVDVTGKIIYSNSLTVKSDGSSQFIGFDNIAAGIYYLTIQDGSKLNTIKVVLQSKE
ncbi:MAG TPA: T9SS type A sorting domain-containing protein [Bacteroidia bacterium]|nr:T9SS type A sorting domain-containing protein [Bacteroidia bacterium]